MGKRADLALLGENPLRDISNTRKIEGVVLHGRWIDKGMLHAQLEQVPADYSTRIEEMRVLLEKDPEQASTLVSEIDPFGAVSASALAKWVRDQDPAALEATLRRLSEELPHSNAVSERAINALGYRLLGSHQYAQAIAALRFNTERFPSSANTWDSLAEAQFKSGDVPQAIQNYRYALEVDAHYPNADKARKFLQDHPRNPQ